LFIFQGDTYQGGGGGGSGFSVLEEGHGSWFIIRGGVGVIYSVVEFFFSFFLPGTGGVGMFAYLRSPGAACCMELCSEVVRAGDRVFVFVRAFGGPV
jgi:hypothetical protein